MLGKTVRFAFATCGVVRPAIGTKAEEEEAGTEEIGTQEAAPVKTGGSTLDTSVRAFA